MSTEANKPRELKFLSDQPTDQDLLGVHRVFAQKIIDIIKSNLKAPYVIGIFGCWGVGKSSIIDMLKSEAAVRDGEMKFAIVDAWTTDKDNFIRHFVGQVGRSLLSASKADQVEKEVNTKESLQDPKWQIDIYGWIAVSVYVLLMIGLIILSLKTHNSDPNVKNLSVSDFVVPISAAMTAVFFSFYLPHHHRKTTVTTEEINIEDPHRFLKIYFDKIINKAKAEKICIVLDNLDRVQPEDAIKMVKTIKTFIVDQEEEPKECKAAKVVFIIPCDDQELSQHLSGIAHIGNSTEFLRKFFNVSLRIPGLIDHDLYAFIENLIKDSDLPFDDEQARIVTFIISRAYKDNLRQPKQFLNQYLASYMLAESFEEEHMLKKGTITQNPEKLAIYLVLQNEFSLIGMPENIDQMREMMNYAEQPNHDQYENDLRKRRATFLRSTERYWEIFQKDVWFALKHLKQPNDMQLIPNFEEIVNAATDNLVEEFTTYAKESGEKPAHLMDKLFNYSEDNVEARINMATTFLKSARSLKVKIFPDRLNRDIRQIVKDKVGGWDQLPGDELYDYVLKDQQNLVNLALDHAITSSQNPEAQQNFTAGRGISFCEELISRILQVEGVETRFKDKIIQILSIYSNLRSILEIGLKYPDLSSLQEMQNGLNLWRDDAEIRTKGEQFIECFKHVEQGAQGQLVDQAIQIVSEVYQANLEAEIPKEAVAFAKQLLEAINSGLLTVEDSQLVGRFGQFEGHYQQTNNWKSRYLVIITMIDFAVLANHPSTSQAAKNALARFIPEFFTSGEIDEVAALLKTKVQTTRDFLIAHLNNAISRDEEICHIVLTNYTDQAASLLPGILSSQPTWVSDWLKNQGKKLGDYAQSVQGAILQFANTNNYPDIAYESLSYIKIRKLPQLVTEREVHFQQVIQQKNPATSSGLQEILRLMDLADYAPNDAQCDQLKSNYANIELSGVPDSENFGRLVKKVLGTCKEEESNEEPVEE